MEPGQVEARQGVKGQISQLGHSQALGLRLGLNVGHLDGNLDPPQAAGA